MSKSDSLWPIVGNRRIIEYLSHAANSKKPAHAYLLYGPSHIGKTTVATYFVHALFCQASTTRPCWQCQACQHITNRIHPEVTWVERERDSKTDILKKNISIGQIRTLIDKLSLRSFADSYKVAVINHAQHLSQEAANALLKTLEEPSGKAVIMLLADEIEHIPKTIVSRCQAFKFLPVDISEIETFVATAGADKKNAKRLAALAFGRPGIAAEYANDGDLYQQYQQTVATLLGFSQQTIGERLTAVATLLNGQDSSETTWTVSVLERIWRDVLLYKAQTPGLIGHIQFAKELEALAARYETPFILSFLRQVHQAKRYLAANINPKLLIENLVLNF